MSDQDTALDGLKTAAMHVVGTAVLQGEVPEAMIEALDSSIAVASKALAEMENRVSKLRNSIHETRSVRNQYSDLPETGSGNEGVLR